MDAKDGRRHGSALSPKTWCSSNGCGPDVVSLQTCQELDCAFEIVKFEASACARTACVARRWPGCPCKAKATFVREAATMRSLLSGSQATASPCVPVDGLREKHSKSVCDAARLQTLAN